MEMHEHSGGTGPNRSPAPEGVDGALEAANPQALLRALESSDRFRRDTRLGGILHYGKISFRELRETDSLHIILDGDRVSAHVDDVSPLVCEPGGRTYFSWKRVVAHNAAVIVADLARRVRGQAGKQRCNLVCGTVWVDDDAVDDLIAEADAVSDAGTGGPLDGDEAAPPADDGPTR